MEPLQSAMQVGRCIVTAANTLSVKSFVSRVVDTVKAAFAAPQFAIATVA